MTDYSPGDIVAVRHKYQQGAVLPVEWAPWHSAAEIEAWQELEAVAERLLLALKDGSVQGTGELITALARCRAAREGKE